jgi:hypothetical protein
MREKNVSIRKSAFSAALILVLSLPFAVRAADTPHWVHYKLLNKSSATPKKVVILPVSVDVFEVTAGDVKEKVPEWSAEAGNNIIRSLSATINNEAGLKVVKMPRLSKNEAASVDEHMALYKLVVNTASTIGWDHKIRRFDYGIGPGLKTLQRKTGADAAVMVYGQDYASTAGRKTKAVLGRIPIVNIFTGAPPTLGHSFVHIGVVDLKTGDLLWMNSEYRDGASNLRDYGDANDIISEIFDWYPGIEEYRKVYVD